MVKYSHVTPNPNWTLYDAFICCGICNILEKLAQAFEFGLAVTLVVP